MKITKCECDHNDKHITCVEDEGFRTIKIGEAIKHISGTIKECILNRYKHVQPTKDNSRETT